LEERDLLDADLIIALNRVEHQPMMEKRFPSWADRITYWDVHDLNIMDSESALSAVEKNIHSLMEDIRSYPFISAHP
jgi:protein-tyrosine phosphatase